MKTMAYGILTTMFLGLIGNGLAMWRNDTRQDTKIIAIEKHNEKQDNRASERDKKIDAIHWYLIERQGIQVPKGK